MKEYTNESLRKVQPDGTVIIYPQHEQSSTELPPRRRAIIEFLGFPATDMVRNWKGLVSCTEADEPLLFGDNDHQQEAKRVVCRPCLVRRECLVDAIDEKEEWGVRGGLTERERRNLVKNNINPLLSRKDPS